MTRPRLSRLPQLMTDADRPAALLTLFFLSGMSGLIYQIAWFRKLALVFGVTSYALGLVLAAFMTGLAIGGVVGGRIAERHRGALLPYAFAEIAIGVMGVASLGLLDLVESVYVEFATILASQGPWLDVFRFALAFLVLLAPTALMGATLPLICGVVQARSEKKDAVSQLYAANTAGAVTGLLLAGFVLLGMAGISASVMIAAVVNIGAGVFLVLTDRGRDQPENLEAGRVGDRVDGQASVRTRTLALLAFAVTGFTALAAEVVWTRLLSVLTLGIVYGFTVTLSVLLAGIAVGSSLYGRWASHRLNPLTHFAVLQAALGLMTAIILLAIPELSEVPLPPITAALLGVGYVSERCPGCPTLLPAMLFGIFVVSLLSGAIFPAAARVCAATGDGWVRRLGAAYAANVIGAVAGSLAGGFWLLPRFGAQASLVTIAFVNLAAGLALASLARRGSAALLIVLAGFLVLGIVAQRSASYDIYRSVLTARLGKGTALSWYEEGVEASVAVAHRETAGHLLLINGEIHGSTGGQSYHRRLGHLGPLLHPNALDVLVIGLGGGTTAGTIARYPWIRVHVVELSGGVMRAARWFDVQNYSVLFNPRLTWEIGDGRQHLMLHRGRYDIIEGDVLQPTHAGAGVVYSKEYFELARLALRPGGIMVQWLGAPGTLEYAWTARTFMSVFPHVTWWMGGDVAIGSNEPQQDLNPQHFTRLLQVPETRSALADVGLDDYAAVAALRAAHSPAQIRLGGIISDDRPAIEYGLTLPVLSRLTFTRER